MEKEEFSPESLASAELPSSLEAIPMKLRDIASFFCLDKSYLASLLVRRNLKVKYRDSYFGYFWSLLLPLFQSIIFFFLYNIVLRVPVENYFVFLITGYFLWTFFVTTITESIDSLIAAKSLITNIKLPLQIFPATMTYTNLIHLILVLPVIIVSLLLFHVELGWRILFSLPLLFTFSIFTYLISFILSQTYILFRDLKYVISVLLQALLYMTPIFFTMDLVPTKFQPLLILNPLSGFFVLWQWSFGLVELQFPGLWLFHIVVSFLLISALAGLVYRKLTKHIVEYL